MVALVLGVSPVVREDVAIVLDFLGQEMGSSSRVVPSFRERSSIGRRYLFDGEMKNE